MKKIVQRFVAFSEKLNFKEGQDFEAALLVDINLRKNRVNQSNK